MAVLKSPKKVGNKLRWVYNLDRKKKKKKTIKHFILKQYQKN